MRHLAAALLVLAATGSALAVEPKFAAAVEAEKYPSVAAPEQAPSFRWDFGAKRDYRFHMDQLVDIHSPGSVDKSVQKVSTPLDADFEPRVRERRFVRGVLAMHIDLSGEIVEPKAAADGAATQAPEATRMSMTADSRIAVTISE